MKRGATRRTVNARNDANPLEDINNTRRITAVYLRGQEVDRAALRAKWTGAHVTETK